MIDVNSPIYTQDETNNNVRITAAVYDLPFSRHNWQFFLDGTNMQEIIPGLFLGSHSSAENHCLNLLLRNDIKYIISVGPDLEAHFVIPHFAEHNITYLTLDIQDHETENIIRFFPRVKEFIDEAISKSCKVLVRSKSGNSRSATLVLAYVMEKYGLSSEDAYNFVKGKRASISPNEGFVAQLTEYEPIYKARQSLNQGEPSSENRRQKRKCEQLTENFEYDLIQPPPSPNNLENNNDDQCQNIEDFSNSLYKLLLKR
ncbi:unnamed protein product [Brassicogethes aeneus]|uniref:Uncharacterized protein n=1 Tax=Brassicogethes aeneus TaxID=1431903 RepID=A0A9P0FMC1_BRAAE|nr:unnamed protein product [Brassicogethes aeneus]